MIRRSKLNAKRPRHVFFSIKSKNCINNSLNVDLLIPHNIALLNYIMMDDTM